MAMYTKQTTLRAVNTNRGSQDILTSTLAAQDTPAPASQERKEDDIYSTPLAPGFLLWKPKNSVKDSSSSGTRVLVLLYTWLLCTPQNAVRYVRLYTSRGFDVLHISSKLQHFLWPPLSRKFALRIASVLKKECDCYTDVIVHAMSVGAYNYTTCLMSASQCPDLQKYLFNKLRANVFDSLTLGSLDHMVNGVAVAASPWRVVQKTSKFLAHIYFFFTHTNTVVAFDEGVDFFKTKPALVPTLVLGAENDPMCDVKSLVNMLHDWKNRGDFPLSYHVWRKSKHCAHLVLHSTDYQRLLEEFFSSVRVFSPPSANRNSARQPNKSSKL